MPSSSSAPRLAVCFPEGPERDRRRPGRRGSLEALPGTGRGAQRGPEGRARFVDRRGHQIVRRGIPQDRRGAATRPLRLRDGFGGHGRAPSHPGGSAVHPHRIPTGCVERWSGGTSMQRSKMSSRCSGWPATCNRAAGSSTNWSRSAISQVVCADLVNAILAAPGLRVEHCDRLLKVFLEHEASSTMAMPRGSAGDYLTARVTLQDIVRHQRELARQLRRQARASRWSRPSWRGKAHAADLSLCPTTSTPGSPGHRPPSYPGASVS